MSNLYLELMKKVLTRIYTVTDPRLYERRYEGHDWPEDADTMIGYRRLSNIQECMEEILRSNVPGDVIEAGVWKGGATIFMRAVLKVYGDTTRKVWVADSFVGLPRPNEKEYPADAGDEHYTCDELAIPLRDVKQNFIKYDLLDEQVEFLPGWFKDTLPNAPIKQLSLIRLDGDMYESTIQAIEALYPKLSHGGYLIIDDYRLGPCRQAIRDYRGKHNITDEIYMVGDEKGSGTVYWRKHSV